MMPIVRRQVLDILQLSEPLTEVEDRVQHLRQMKVVEHFTDNEHKAIDNESFRLRSKFTGGYREITRRNKNESLD